jgi:hypothetical protein
MSTKSADNRGMMLQAGNASPVSSQNPCNQCNRTQQGILLVEQKSMPVYLTQFLSNRARSPTTGFYQVSICTCIHCTQHCHSVGLALQQQEDEAAKHLVCTCQISG